MAAKLQPEAIPSTVYLYIVETFYYKLAGKADLATIHDLAQRVWRKHYPGIISNEQIEYMLGNMYSEEALTEQMAQGHVFWIVSSGNQPLGYLSYSAQGDGDYFLHKFYIDTTTHRKGIGTSFFYQVFDAIKDLKRLRLTVNRRNYTAINYYFKQGFRIEEVKDFDIGSGYEMNDFIMLLEKSR